MRPGAVAIPNAWDQRLAGVPAGAEGDGHHCPLPQPGQEGALRLLALPILTLLHTDSYKRPLSDVDNGKGVFSNTVKIYQMFTTFPNVSPKFNPLTQFQSLLLLNNLNQRLRTSLPSPVPTTLHTSQRTKLTLYQESWMPPSLNIQKTKLKSSLRELSNWFQLCQRYSSIVLTNDKHFLP